MQTGKTQPTRETMTVIPTEAAAPFAQSRSGGIACRVDVATGTIVRASLGHDPSTSHGVSRAVLRLG
jgi:hypothetical protein